MQDMIYLPVERLHPHPDNPRKDLGDLTELADSIKANGIFQNLTVVPDGDEYTVIIGHRRLSAAKLAGLATVPCVVTEMPPREQVQTMLLENMQRSDLTVYEQAQGFQLMLDMGDTVEEIAEKSGFSASTVRRRVKLLELDPDEFKKSEARGATLQDYIELEKIEDPDQKNEVLKSIGTANFSNKLKTVLDGQEAKKYIDTAKETVSTFATLIEKSDYSTMEHITSYNRWDRKREVEVPEDSETARYYYTVSDNSVSVYRDREDTPVDPEKEAEQARYAAIKAKHDGIKKQAQEISDRHFSLRCDFVHEVSKTRAEKCMGDIVTLLADLCTGHQSYYSSSGWLNDALLAQLLDIEYDKDDGLDFMEVAEKCKASPKTALLAVVFSALERPAGTYFREDWCPENRCYKVVYKQNDNLDKCYALLEALGYEMSDEEVAMQDATHAIFEEAE